MSQLDLGCGRRKKKGCIGVDISADSDADIVHDLNQFPYPFEANSFDIIHASDCLEHLDDIINVMEEVHRIAKPKAKVLITVPHFSSHNFYTDLTHKHPFGVRSLDFFSPDESSVIKYLQPKACFRIISKRIEPNRLIFNFMGRWIKIRNRLLGFLINLTPLVQDIYERFFAFVFTAEGVHFELEVIKQQTTEDIERKKTLIDYNVTLGDTICLTGVIREYKKKHQNEKLFVKSNYPELFDYSKYAENVAENASVQEFANTFKLDWRAFPERRNRHIVDNIAEQMGINIKPEERIPEVFIKDYEIRIFERRFTLPKSRPVVVISPYSRWQSKDWSEQKWREVGQYLINKYNAFLIQVGKENEPYLGVGSNWLGMTDVRTLAILLNKSTMFLSVDNGIHHLAAAVGTTGIVLFGPLKPEHVAYPRITYAINADFGCTGCYHKMEWDFDKPPRFCPIETYECMRNISVDQVVCALDSLMHKCREKST